MIGGGDARARATGQMREGTAGLAHSTFGAGSRGTAASGSIAGRVLATSYLPLDTSIEGSALTRSSHRSRSSRAAARRLGSYLALGFFSRFGFSPTLMVTASAGVSD